MSTPFPSWRRFTDHLSDLISDVEKALEEQSVKDKHYLNNWEWIQILRTVIQVSHRRRQWRIDPTPLIRPILRNLEQLPGDRLEIARINLYAFADALYDFTADSELDMMELKKLVDSKQKNVIQEIQTKE
jgi:hypothetical protein